MTERPHGFMLLEVLVAFTLLAVTLAALLQASGTGLRATAAAEHKLAATALAENLLAGIGTEVALAPGAVHGVEGVLRWELRLDRLPTVDASAVPGATAIEPYRGEVTVRDARSTRVLITLTSVRLALPEAGIQ